MADQQQQQTAIAAPFPAPPPFYNHFTKDNLSALRQIQKDATRSQRENGDPPTSSTTNPPLDLLALPPELRYLLPPPPPTPSTPYRTFGSTINHTAPDLSLSDAGIPQLYPNPTPSSDESEQNPQPHLLALARSLLTTFLSLIGSLSTNPGLFEERVEDLQTMMYNLHDLVNRYRPHQGRESLILMMEERVGRMREETRRVVEGRERVEGVVRGLREAEVVGGMDGGAEREALVREEAVSQVSLEEKQGGLWSAMDGEMGTTSGEMDVANGEMVVVSG